MPSTSVYGLPQSKLYLIEMNQVHYCFSHQSSSLPSNLCCGYCSLLPVIVDAIAKKVLRVCDSHLLSFHCLMIAYAQIKSTGYDSESAARSIHYFEATSSSFAKEAALAFNLNKQNVNQLIQQWRYSS